MLNRAKIALLGVSACTHHNRQGKITNFKNPSGIGQGDTGGVNCGKRVAKLDIFGSGDVNVSSAGANDFITGAAIRCRTGYPNRVGRLTVLADCGVGSRGGGVWNGGIKFSYENRPLAGQGIRRHRAAVGSGSHI